VTGGSVGFVGLGVMGSAMAAHLLRGGYPVNGFDTDPDRVEFHLAQGGLAADSAREVGEKSDVIITSLPTAEALTEVLFGHAGLVAAGRPDLLVIETSTLALGTKVMAAQRLSELGGTLLDCPMSGTGQQARDGDLVAYQSGPGPAKARALPVLEAFTRGVHDLGAFGNGTKMKLVANLLVAVHNVAAAEGLLLAERAGLDLATVLEAVGDGAGTSRMFEVRGPMMSTGEYDDATMRVSTFQKDIAIITRFAAEMHSPTPLFAIAKQIYETAVQQGRGGQDTASVFAVLAGDVPAPRVGAGDLLAAEEPPENGAPQR